MRVQQEAAAVFPGSEQDRKSDATGSEDMDRFKDRGGTPQRAQLMAAGLKVVGPGSSSLKYDLLTALLVLSAQDAGPRARLALRLSLVITARFNWRQGQFAVGLRELARMWGVTERTAKREMAQMRSLGWISVERQAARGRVAHHRINFDALLRDTMPHWDAVGPDFTARMSGAGSEAAQTEASNVVPLHTNSETNPPQDGTIWADVATQLHQQDAALYSAWFGKLVEVEITDGVLTLAAPNLFIADYVKTHHTTRLLSAASLHAPSVRRIQIVCL